LEDLSIDHGGFDGNMCGIKAVKLDDQFETGLWNKLTTYEASTKCTLSTRHAAFSVVCK